VAPSGPGEEELPAKFHELQPGGPSKVEMKMRRNL